MDRAAQVTVSNKQRDFNSGNRKYNIEGEKIGMLWASRNTISMWLQCGSGWSRRGYKHCNQTNQQDGSKEILNRANVGAQSRSRNKLPT